MEAAKASKKTSGKTKIPNAVVRYLADAAGADVVVVVNPDNPTGRLIEPPALRAIDTRLLVIDEAFIDLLPSQASPRWAGDSFS